MAKRTRRPCILRAVPNPEQCDVMMRLFHFSTITLALVSATACADARGATAQQRRRRQLRYLARPADLWLTWGTTRTALGVVAEHRHSPALFRMPKTLLLLLAVAALGACKGPEGPMGPRGPAGSVGPAGPGTRLEFTGAIPAGGAITIPLPLSAGTLRKPPLLACYLYFSAGTLGGTLWAPTSSPDSPNSQCYLNAPNPDASITVILDGATSGQGYYIILIY
jgi:hypothetical protein